MVDREQNEGQGTFIGPLFRSGADAERWLKEKGHTDTAVHTLPITDALKRMAKEKGFPLFKRGGAVRGYASPARAFTVPFDVVRKLGNGDIATGLAVLRDTFDVPFAGPPDVIPAEAVGAIGGKQVVLKFLNRIRSQRRA